MKTLERIVQNKQQKQQQWRI